MKKWMALVFAWVCVLALASCGENDTYKISITIPAGSTAPFVYSDEEISATGDTITISSGEGLGDTEVLLSPVDETVEAGYVATHLPPGTPVSFDAAPGDWFKIGVSVQNDTDTDKIVFVEVKGVEVRIE